MCTVRDFSGEVGGAGVGDRPTHHTEGEEPLILELDMAGWRSEQTMENHWRK